MSGSAAPKQRVTGLVVRSAVIASLGGLVFAFVTAMNSGAISSLTEVFDLTPTDVGSTVAIAAFVLGAAFLICFVFMVMQLIWVPRMMPRTKGVPLEKMTAELALSSR